MKINKLKSKMVMDPSDYMKVFHLDSLPKLDKPVIVTFNQDMYQYIRGLNLEENKAGETLQQDKYFDIIRGKDTYRTFVTGDGGPAAAFSMELLAERGASLYVGIGYCVSICPDKLQIGDCFIPSGCILEDGTSRMYTNDKVLGDKELIEQVSRVLSEVSEVKHGKSCCVDSFFQCPTDSLADWKKDGGMTLDMESGAFYAVANHYHIPAILILVVAETIHDTRWEVKYPLARKTINSIFDKIDDIIRVANGASGNREEQRTSWNNIIREQLFNLAEEDFRKFSSKLLPGIDNIIGVRFNYLRKMAKRIVKKDWKMYLANASDEYFEEVMLQGMTIGYVNVEVKELQFLITNFIMKIDNWSVCDSFCSGLKITKKYQDEMWEYIENCCYSAREFTCRFGLVMLLDYYLEEKYLDQVFKIIDSIEHEGYYAKMANAWLLSIIYMNFPQRTEEYLKVSKLDNETYNKAISKILDSKRIGKETKNRIKKLRRI